MVVVLSTGVAAWSLACSVSSAPAAPAEVLVAEAALRDVAVPSEWSATLDGYVNARIRPQVSGHLLEQRYREGAVVKEGEVLFTIDSHAFESALAHARARLREAQAQLEWTLMSVRHSTLLVKQGALRPVQLANDVRANAAALAAVESATLDVETALRNLGLTRVTTPIGGVAAMANAQIGDLVGPATLLTTVSQVDPIKVYFPVSEQEYLTLAWRLTFAPGRAPPGPSARLRLLLADGQAYPYSGSFLAADREVDEATATIRVAAVFANPGHVLRPGQRVRVQANTETIARAVVVPARAVAELQGVHRVRVVRPDNRVWMQSVKVGVRTGAEWVIEDGLNPGERVVIEAAPRLTDGAPVRPKMAGAADEGR